MNKPRLNNKIQFIIKLITSSVLFVVLLFTIISYAAEGYIKNKINDIKELSVTNIRVAWHCNHLYLKDVIYKKNGHHVTAKKLEFINIQWFSLLKNKTIHLKEIVIKDVDINLSNIKNKTNSKTFKNFEFAFKVNHVQIENTNINAVKADQKLNIKALNADLENLEINKNNLSFKNIKYATSKGIYTNINSDYKFTWDKIDTNQKTTTLYNAHLNPLISDAEWRKKYPYKKPITELKIPKLSVSNIDYNAIIQKKSIILDKILLKDALLTVLVDENKDPDPNAYKPLLNELLYSSKVPIKIQEIILENNRIDIEVISKKTKQKALIFFNKINASIHDIQNIKEHKINLELKALVLNKNTINLDIDFWLTPKLFPYTIKGNVSPFDFEQFNSFLLLNKRIRIHSGACTRLDFSIYGNNTKAYGDIILDYKNVKIGLFDDDEHIIEKLPTFLINNFLIKQNNIPNTKNYRTGNMYYKRPKNRSMYHSWWYTLKSGFQSVILPNMINPKELDHKNKNT
ncbi:hypothetical protein QVZ41_09665 [Wenyingzhuangia sp. chi5]|uniref:DUF748 domain-containing protein n=1 Tax=Wenyingzhuangia gilva TaxID=3057677 RepID=A0ABT8VT45_9FLAO|nr:hypothetical protein [Wenyingzhuangia sp. chi5]MDO3695110.1 hypothetical protein [Wenyingzhuangia sp. chi5]